MCDDQSSPRLSIGYSHSSHTTQPLYPKRGTGGCLRISVLVSDVLNFPYPQHQLVFDSCFAHPRVHSLVVHMLQLIDHPFDHLVLRRAGGLFHSAPSERETLIQPVGDGGYFSTGPPPPGMAGNCVELPSVFFEITYNQYNQVSLRRHGGSMLFVGGKPSGRSNGMVSTDVAIELMERMIQGTRRIHEAMDLYSLNGLERCLSGGR
ncbi:hypothetical protein F5X98DRAFT_186499, partial [Xylaria grammica]